MHSLAIPFAVPVLPIADDRRPIGDSRDFEITPPPLAFEELALLECRLIEGAR